MTTQDHNADPARATAHNRVLQALTRLERPLIRYTTRVLDGDVERARDVVQEAFLRLCREPGIRGLPPVDEAADSRAADSESRLAAWLFRVCRNLALDVRRKEKRMEPMTEAAARTRPSDEPGPAQTAMQRDSVSQVAVAIAGLPDSQQEILQLRFQHGMSYRELSDVTGRSISAVGVLVHKGIKALRHRLGKELGTPLAAHAGASLGLPGLANPNSNTETQR